MSEAQEESRPGDPGPAPARELLERIRREQRRTLRLLTVCAVGLVPWTVLLALTLPSHFQVHQWRLAWVGFDVLLVVATAATAILGWLRNKAVIVPAVGMAVLLICDAWFDVSLTFGTSGVWLSVALAVFAELPLAAYLIVRVTGLISLGQWPSVESPREGSSKT
ncbi:hypothetical protein QBC31_39245 [Streptomyces sp. B21-079]|uniref:hypothetical protein n=1 Tax=Streptomyces sp. B21-079 TaxID=3039409 RepID=UPI002FF0D8A2